MKKNWFWPVVVSVIILTLFLIMLVYAGIKVYQAHNTLVIERRMKTHVLTVDGEVKQELGFYYLKGEKTEPVLMHVKLGDYVQKGDPLYTYVDEQLSSEETKVDLQLDNKRIEKEQVEGQIAAYEAMQSTVDSDESDTIEAQLNWLDSELSKAENNINILEQRQKKVARQIEALTINAGADGEVVDVDNEQVQAFTKRDQTKPVVTLSVEALKVKGLISRYAVQYMETNLKFKGKVDTEPDMTYKGQIESFSKTPISHIEEGTVTAVPKRAAAEVKGRMPDEFEITGILNKTTPLYDGDHMTVQIYPSYKNHIWLPKRFVEKRIITQDDKGKKLASPVTKYYVSKVYGSETNKELVTVAKRIDDQYLITKGLSSIDVIKAIH